MVETDCRSTQAEECSGFSKTVSGCLAEPLRIFEEGDGLSVFTQ